MDIERLIAVLVCESVSIGDIGQVLNIATATVTEKINATARGIIKPAIPVNRASFELDEVRTYVGMKENQYWIAYNFYSYTKQTIDFIVGQWTKRVLRMIVNWIIG